MWGVATGRTVGSSPVCPYSAPHRHPQIMVGTGPGAEDAWARQTVQHDFESALDAELHGNGTLPEGQPLYVCVVVANLQDLASTFCQPLWVDSSPPDVGSRLVHGDAVHDPRGIQRWASSLPLAFDANLVEDVSGSRDLLPLCRRLLCRMFFRLLTGGPQ